MRFLKTTALVAASMLPIAITMPTEARPVSYPSGWTAMVMNNGDYNSAHIHYSPSAKYSIGYRFEHRRESDAELHLGQLNYLVKRRNTRESQANIYLKTAIGVADDHGGQNAAGSIGFATDWETRKHFISYENRYLSAGPIENGFTQSARIGIAPYVADYGSLHTWLMLEASHDPEADDKLEITPLVRFFKGPNLAEFGVSTDGDVTFNFIKRF